MAAAGLVSIDAGTISSGNLFDREEMLRLVQSVRVVIVEDGCVWRRAVVRLIE